MNAEPIYYTPRDTFDPAVIEVRDGLVFYSRSKLMSILVEEYVSNLEALTQYRGSPRSYLERLAERSAVKWLIYIRHSQHYGAIERRPVIVDDE